MGEVLDGSLLQLLLKNCDFLNIDISQGSVATCLRCGGIFKYELVANLPVSLPVKELWKSVNIWGSYGVVSCFFWDTVYIAAAVAINTTVSGVIRSSHTAVRRANHSATETWDTCSYQLYSPSQPSHANLSDLLPTLTVTFALLTGICTSVWSSTWFR